MSRFARAGSPSRSHALAGLVAAPAGAATVQVQIFGPYLTFDAAPGETNDVTITQNGPSRFTVTDTGAAITAGPGCTGDATTVTCTSSVQVNSVQVQLGDGDDEATVSTTAGTSVEGQAGDDVLSMSGGGGLYGGDGDDTLTGGDQQVTFIPGTGVNSIVGGAGGDYLYSAGGADTADLGGGDDRIAVTGAGDDDVQAGSGVDYLAWDYFGFGMAVGDIQLSLDDVANDGEVELSQASNFHSDIENVTTASGNDLISGSPIANIISSGGGNDVVYGNAGRDKILTSYGDDVLKGGGDDDKLSGGEGNDTVFGGSGDDDLDSDHGVGPSGTDVFLGGKGVDFVAVYRDADVSVTLDDQADDGQRGENDNIHANVEDVATGDGDDVLVGTNAANELSGGGGSDTIDGLGGHDGLEGGYGRDTLVGGAKRDSISGGGNVDTITSEDASADYVTCGSSTDFVDADARDQVAVDCEKLS